MTHPQYPPTQEETGPPAAPRRRRVLWTPVITHTVAALFGVLVGSVSAYAGAMAGIEDAVPSWTVTEEQPASAAPPIGVSTPTASSAYGTPTETDFALAVVVLRRACYGSAGCNVSYKLDVTYTGPKLDPTETYEVRYEVRGGEDGPVINTLRVTGEDYYGGGEQFIGTRSVKSKLTISVIDVT